MSLLRVADNRQEYKMGGIKLELNDILIEVLERGASDLHLTAGIPPSIRLRGSLIHLDYPRLSPVDTQNLIYSILTQEQRERLERNWEFDFSYSLPGRARFIKVSAKASTSAGLITVFSFCQGRCFICAQALFAGHR